jgi:hypothetical protein
MPRVSCGPKSRSKVLLPPLATEPAASQVASRCHSQVAANYLRLPDDFCNNIGPLQSFATQTQLQLSKVKRTILGNAGIDADDPFQKCAAAGLIFR